jgi:hypothetical protein
MRPANSAVTALLADVIANHTPYVYADCFTFEFVFGGLKAYYTNAQQDIVTIPIDGTLIAQRFLSNSVQVHGARMKLEVGATVDEQDIEIDCPASEMLDGVPWPAAALAGFFDGCIVRRDRFFSTDWASMYNDGPLGGVPMFLGRISTFDAIGRQSLKAKVKSYLVLADVQMPRELQGPSCKNALYDAQCTVNKASFTSIGAAGAGTNASIINWTSATTQYAGGGIQFATGPNAGATRSIKNASSSQLFLAFPFEFQPGVGDTFEAWFG